MADCVIILHGLGRTSQSMSSVENMLKDENYHVVNLGYESRKYEITDIAPQAIEPALEQCQTIDSDAKINIVTHSMGGILIREYLNKNTIKNLRRVVMLAPPNHGSELADHFKSVLGYPWLIGKPMQELGTGESDKPKSLGAVTYDVGVIAGSKSLNPFYSYFVNGEDDGKVSIKSTYVDGMKDHIVLPVSHSFLMNDSEVQSQILHFFDHGKFNR